MTPLTTVAARRRSSTRRNRRCSSRGRSVERSVRSGGLTRAFAVALQGRPCTRRTPPPASASRPSICWRGDRRRSSRGRSLRQSCGLARRGRGRGARRLARHPLEFLQLGLRDLTVHAPMPPFFPLLTEMSRAEHVAARRWRSRALRAQAVPPSTSQTFLGVHRAWRETTPLGVRGQRPRAWLDSSRRPVRGRGARGPASVVVVTVARAAPSWRGPPALRAPARRRLRLPRSVRRGANARGPAARPMPLARGLAVRLLLPRGRSRRRRRRSRGTGGSTAAAAAAAPRTAAAAGRRPRRTANFVSPRARRAQIRKHVRPALRLLRISKLPPWQSAYTSVVKARVLILADHPERNVMPTMHRRPRPGPWDMHNHAREVVVAPALLRRQSLREPNAPPVIGLVVRVRTERPSHGDEQNGGQPVEESVLGCSFIASPAKISRDPFSIAEVRVGWTRKINAIDKLDLPPEQVLQVDHVFPTRAHLLHVHKEHVLNLASILHKVALLAKRPVASENPENVLLDGTTSPVRLPFHCTEGLESVSEELIGITLARPELLHRKDPVTRGDRERGLLVRPVTLHRKRVSLGGESAHGAAEPAPRTAPLHVRVEHPPDRPHAEEHLRDRIHKARFPLVTNPPTSAVPLQLTQHMLPGDSICKGAQVQARRQRLQQLRHAARGASRQHGYDRVPPDWTSPGAASAPPGTSAATRGRTCGPRRVPGAAAAPAPPRRLSDRRNVRRWHRQRLARAQRVRGQRRLHGRRSGRRPVRSSGSSGVVVDARLLTDAR